MTHPTPTQMAARLRWFGRTERGPIRPNNEDAFLGIQFDAREVNHLGSVGEAPLATMDLVFAVSDGMGGAKSGEFASRLAVDRITTLLPRAFHQTARGWKTDFADVLTELFDQIHRALKFVGESYVECAGMETTLSLCWFTPGRMYFAHIGDTRIYYLPAREGGMKQLTQDDTHVGWLLRNGHINERQARTHPRRNVLQKALGGGNQFVDPQVGAVAYEPGDIFLLCSDGLVHGLTDERLAEILRPGDASPREFDAARHLVHEALATDGSDNTTALVICVN